MKQYYKTPVGNFVEFSDSYDGPIPSNFVEIDFETYSKGPQTCTSPESTTDERVAVLEAENARLLKNKKLMDAQITAMTDRNDFMEECIAEMATLVYTA